MMHHLSNGLAIVVAILVVGCLAYDVRRSLYRILLGRTVVLVSVLYWYLLEAIRVPEALESYTPGENHFGLFCVALSVLVFLAAYHGTGFNLFGALGRRLSVLDNPQVLWRMMLAGMAIGFGSLLIYVDFNVFAFFEGLTGMTRRWTGSLARERYGSWSTILYEMQMFLQAVVPLAVCLAAMRRALWFQRCVAALFVSWMAVRTLFTGTRSSLVPIALCVAAAFFWRAGPRLRRGLVFIGIPVALVGAFLLSAIIVAGRNQGRFDVSAATSTDYVGYEMYRELLFIIRSERDGLPLERGMTYFTQLVNPIPRAIWPSKPVADAGLILARAYGAVDRFGEPTMTTSPGFLGEAYLNFGFLGIFIVPAVAGVIVRAWDRLLPLAAASLPAFLVYAVGLATMYESGRSFNMSAFYGLLALFVLLIVFEQLGWADQGQQVQRALKPANGSQGRAMSRN
jgi:oligosaccharide repeat unit polymerase